MGDTRQRQEGVRATYRHRGLRGAQAVGDGDVVAGETMDQHKRTLESRRVLHDAVSVVDVWVEAQIALGVMRVARRPVGGRGAGARGFEHVRHVQHDRYGQEATVRLVDHAHFAGVRHRNRFPLTGGDAKRRWAVLGVCLIAHSRLYRT